MGKSGLQPRHHYVKVIWEKLEAVIRAGSVRKRGRGSMTLGVQIGGLVVEGKKARVWDVQKRGKRVKTRPKARKGVPSTGWASGGEQPGKYYNKPETFTGTGGSKGGGSESKRRRVENRQKTVNAADVPAQTPSPSRGGTKSGSIPHRCRELQEGRHNSRPSLVGDQKGGDRGPGSGAFH